MLQWLALEVELLKGKEFVFIFITRSHHNDQCKYLLNSELMKVYTTFYIALNILLLLLTPILVFCIKYLVSD